jgi:hypothetical protein
MTINLAASQRQMVHDIILLEEHTAAQIADAASCSVRAFK